MTDLHQRLTNETVELLQAMIRNACVNDGSPSSGEEVRNAQLLDGYLDGLDLRSFEPFPGRRSLLATVEGSDPRAPTVLLLGHTDVVPVSPDDWRHDPFGGELIDGEVWGRGAVDMLNLTSSMAVAVKHLATRGRRPRSTIKLLAVADEEAGGTWGAGWISEHAWNDVACDYVLSESGGIPFPTPSGMKVVIGTGEKGIGWRQVTVHGTPGHGSLPYLGDNALVTAAEVVSRLHHYEPRARIDESWRDWVSVLPLDDRLREALLDPDRVRGGLAALERQLAAYGHALTHTTFSPNVIRGGTKTNVIPDRVEIEVDIRPIAGVTDEAIDAMLLEAIGDLADRVEVSRLITGRAATASSPDTPMFDLLERRARAVHPGAEVLPWTMTGGTDAAFFRARGVPCYGAGLFSTRAPLTEFRSRFHGHDERIDTDSLGLSTQLWIDVADGLGAVADT